MKYTLLMGRQANCETDKHEYLLSLFFVLLKQCAETVGLGPFLVQNQHAASVGSSMKFKLRDVLSFLSTASLA